MGAVAASLVSRITPLLIATIGAFLGGMVLMHKFDAGELANYKLAVEKEHTAALAAAAAKQKEIDDQALAASSAEAAQQAAIAASLQKELANAKAHLSVKQIAATCVPYGFWRVLYAGGHGVTADSLALPSGKSDDTCAPAGWADLAAAILHDYGNARANGEQLDALNALLRKQQLVTEKK